MTAITAGAAVGIDEASAAAARSILTPSEWRYCMGRARPMQHVAGRLAARRAVCAVLVRAGRPEPALRDVEIVPAVPRFPAALAWQPARRPVCRATTADADLASALTRIRVSISHCGDVAVAAALLAEPDATTRGAR